MSKGKDLGTELIRRALPHRHPFLFVDKVLSYRAGESIVAQKNVTIAEPYFEGHFPQKPVLPGVIILEALAQTCGVLFYLSRDESERQYFLLTGIDKCRFRQMVQPGDTLILHCELQRHRQGQGGDLCRFAARAEVADAVVCEAEIVAVQHSA